MSYAIIGLGKMTFGLGVFGDCLALRDGRNEIETGSGLLTTV
ncbi:hypothetical protein ACPPVV_12075 [Rhodanobacter sp. Col0626]